MARPDVKAEYANWLATPKRLRLGLGLPTSKAKFAELKGVSSRTLRRWQEDEEFLLAVEQRRKVFADEGPNSSVAAKTASPRPHTDARSRARFASPEPAGVEDDPVVTPELSADEAQFAKVKDTLAKMAEDGSTQALDLWLKHFGKSFIAAEQDSGFEELRGMSDREVLAEVLALSGRDAALSSLVADWVASASIGDG